MNTANPGPPEISHEGFKRSKLKAFMVVAFVICGAVVMYFADPTTTGFFPKCLLYFLTGIYCPGCGSARASHAFLHGHIRAAMGYNFLFALAMPVVGYYVLSNIMILAGKKPLPEPKINATVAWILVAAIFLFMILRNIPAYPFNILAP